MEIPLPNLPGELRSSCDTNDLYQIIRETLQNVLVRVDPDDILALDEHEDPVSGRTRVEKVRYELRLVPISFSESGIRGRCSRLQFAGIVAVAFDQALLALQREQPGCRWSLIAAHLDRFNVAQVHERAFDGAIHSEAKVSDWVTSKVPVALERKVDYTHVADYRAIASLVFCDLEQGDLQDPATYSPEGKGGPFARYAEHRLLRHLTPSQRDARKSAEELVGWFYENADADRFKVNLGNQPAREESDEMAELRARLAALERENRMQAAALEARPVPSPFAARPPESDAAPEISTPQTVPRALELKPEIFRLRIEEQLTPSAIGKRLNLPTDDVKVILASESP
jgi:hypothetical protein